MICTTVIMNYRYSADSQQSKKPMWMRYFRSTYTSVCEMFNCGVEVENPHDHSGHTSSQMLLKVGYSFFILMTTAAYTASLAAQLTNQLLSVQTINNIEECIAADCNVCIHGAQEDTLETSYQGRLKTTVVGYSSAEVIAEMVTFDPVAAHDCDAFILDSATIELKHESGLCAYMYVVFL